MNQIAWDLFFVAKGDSSQYGEEALIKSTVNHFGSKTYLEIGAHQPIKCSNSWKLYKKGWRGLCVDPQENFKINWRIFRPKDIFLPVAISPVESDFVRFFDFERRVNLVSTIDPVFAEEWLAMEGGCAEVEGEGVVVDQLRAQTKEEKIASDKRAFDLVDTFLRRIATSDVEKVD
jgi:hypothetical protein